MKRPVSLVASLALAAVAGACGAAEAGRAEFTEICLDRMGGAQEKCSCYVASIEKELSPENFARVAQAAYDNRRFNGMLPAQVSTDPAIGSAVQTATMSCFV
jgi:hypothetical protein